MSHPLEIHQNERADSHASNISHSHRVNLHASNIVQAERANSHTLQIQPNELVNSKLSIPNNPASVDLSIFVDNKRDNSKLLTSSPKQGVKSELSILFVENELDIDIKNDCLSNHSITRACNSSQESSGAPNEISCVDSNTESASGHSTDAQTEQTPCPRCGGSGHGPPNCPSPA